jgi:hypothetical protein
MARFQASAVLLRGAQSWYMLVVVYRLLLQPVVPIFKDEAVREECLSLENGSDKLSGTVGEQLPIYTA